MSEPQKKNPETVWLSTIALRQKPERVDVGAGIIYGAAVTTMGEAKGHGIHLEESFVDDTIKAGNAKKGGLKARFGHPNMCSDAIGTFLGKWKNFRKGTSADGKPQAIADLFLSNEAKQSPSGDLYTYILGMAQNEPDQFGVSIVFTANGRYKREEDGTRVDRPGYDDSFSAWDRYDAMAGPEYVEMGILHAADTVDDPAANDGLFSSGNFAGQVTAFLDAHPDIFSAIDSNPDLIPQFLSRYEQYQKNNKKEAKMATQEPSASEPDATPNPAPVPAAVPAEEPKPEDAPALSAKPDNPPTEQSFSVAEFSRMVEEFGASAAADAVKNGTGYNGAKDAHYKAIADENARLKAENQKLSAGAPHPAPTQAAAPAKFADGEKAKGTPKKIKRLRDAVVNVKK